MKLDKACRSARVRDCRGGLSALAIAVAVTATPASAQATSDTSGPDSTAETQGAYETDAIVVTARRRDETLQEVPIAVSAIGGEQIASGGLTHANELQSLVPNLTINGAFGVVNPQIFIRGIGNNDYNDNAGAAVGVYVDDVYLSAPAGKLVQMYDLESAQIFRGPQGTLFGKNNTAGAIVLTSKKPDGYLEGYVRATVGNFATANVEGAISFPIATDFSARVAVQKNSRGGYATNLSPTGTDNGSLGSADELAGRVILRYNPGRLDASLNLNYSRARNDRLPGKSYGIGVGGANGAGWIDPYVDDARINSANYKEIENANTRGAFININYDFDWARLSSISSYYYADRYVTLDTDKSPSNLLHIIRNPTSNQYSQEVRLASQGKNTIDWVAGLYYLREDLKVDTLFAFGGPEIPFYPQNYNSDTRTIAGFAEAILHLNDKLSFTGGLRYTSDNRIFDIVVGPGGNAVPYTRFERTWNNLSWRGIVDYKIAPDNIVYASVSRGFQGGGFNGGAFSVAEVGNGYNPETITAYEAGVKTSFLGGRLTFNATAFYYDYKDPQVFTLNGGQAGESAVGIIQTITNAEGATIKGLEFEAKASLTPTLVIDGSLGLIESGYGELSLLGPNNTIISGKGNRLISAPDVNVVFGVTKTIPTSSGAFTLHGDVNHQSRRYFDITQRELMSGKPYTIVNVRLDYTPDSERFSVALWAKNLTDETYESFKADLSSFGYIETFFNMPRTYGAELTYRF
jgi:iron complex outermembrane receptor protein